MRNVKILAVLGLTTLAACSGPAAGPAAVPTTASSTTTTSTAPVTTTTAPPPTSTTTTQPPSAVRPSAKPAATTTTKPPAPTTTTSSTTTTTRPAVTTTTALPPITSTSTTATTVPTTWVTAIADWSPSDSRWSNEFRLQGVPTRVRWSVAVRVNAPGGCWMQMYRDLYTTTGTYQGRQLVWDHTAGSGQSGTTLLPYLALPAPVAGRYRLYAVCDVPLVPTVSVDELR